MANKLSKIILRRDHFDHTHSNSCSEYPPFPNQEQPKSKLCYCCYKLNQEQPDLNLECCHLPSYVCNGFNQEQTHVLLCKIKDQLEAESFLVDPYSMLVEKEKDSFLVFNRVVKAVTEVTFENYKQKFDDNWCQEQWFNTKIINKTNLLFIFEDWNWCTGVINYYYKDKLFVTSTCTSCSGLIGDVVIQKGSLGIITDEKEISSSSILDNTIIFPPDCILNR